MAESDNSWNSDEMPDEIFEARLRSEANQRSYLWELYSTGAAYTRSSVQISPDNIRFLYGDAVSGRVRVLLSREMTCESTLNEICLLSSLKRRKSVDSSQQN
jgi:hypothetical protein